MKRFNLLLSLTCIFASLTASGQWQGDGFVNFSDGPRPVWNGFTFPDISAPRTNVLVSFLWGPNGDVPLVDGILPGVPTNMTSSTIVFSPADAWTAILNDPNFVLATNDYDNSLVIANIYKNFSILYSPGPFPLQGAGQAVTYSVFVIGWDAAYATPQLAAAAGAAVGWSEPFAYVTLPLIATPNTFASLKPFGVIGPGAYSLKAKISYNEGNVTLTWNALSGSTYSVLRSTNLTDWRVLVSGYPSGGATNGPVVYIDYTSYISPTFYRISSP
jgi:hypothetical protein